MNLRALLAKLVRRERGPTADLVDVSRRVLLFYVQNNGGGVSKAVEALNAAVRWAGIDSEFRNDPPGWHGATQLDNERARAMRAAIDAIYRESWEMEHWQIMSILDEARTQTNRQRGMWGVLCHWW